MPALSAKQGPGPTEDENPVIAIHLDYAWALGSPLPAILWPCLVTTQCP